MALFKPNISHFSSLKDKVVVLTGGATGIGAATVKLLAQYEAKVVFGDVNAKDADALAAQFPSILFQKCDVSNYRDIYDLFRTAYDTHGRIDHAISCAGIFENTKWFDPALTIDSVGDDAGNTSVLDVNVLGSAHFSRVAVVFMREGHRQGENKSLTLLSSVNAFRESPGLHLYQASKHAIHGFMRASRKPLFEQDHIQLNCVCPGVTDTNMTIGIIEKFQQANLVWQKPESVAEVILEMLANTSVIGKAVYVEGGDGWEFEDSLYATQEQWLGTEPTRRMRLNAEAINKGALTGGK